MVRRWPWNNKNSGGAATSPPVGALAGLSGGAQLPGICPVGVGLGVSGIAETELAGGLVRGAVGGGVFIGGTVAGRAIVTEGEGAVPGRTAFSAVVGRGKDADGVGAPGREGPPCPVACPALGMI